MAFRGSQAVLNTASATTVVFTVVDFTPAVPQTGDIIEVLIMGGGGATSITPPSGWIEVPETTGITTASGTLLNVFHHVFSGSDTTYTFTVNQNDFHGGEARAYSGRNTTSPFTAVSQTGPVSPGTNPITFATTGVTAAAGDDIVIFNGVNGLGNTTQTLTYAPPSGFGNVSAPALTVSFEQAIADSDFVNNPGGATGTLGGTLTNSRGATAAQYGTYVLSLAAAAAGSTAPIAWIT
jgi:hypothetical protein